ncbi:hypothetical protein VHEMI08154 [[Torrubiella] hemipterigena]|uniref:Neprosin PEP catalytic domain-containing protein n=1 Tax=[Torrubiella] hemipterigena TaxID=1531966 RepID=A0A0A1TMX1_9HYPO|nr:hypothetical protein VHEMI08154 [[Torrubiella] hemipterigena]
MLSQALQSLVGSLVAAATGAAALPANAPLPPVPHGFNIVKTTTNSQGQVIDWIRREDQGPIATPPPTSVPGDSLANLKSVQELVAQPRYQGLPGTVPVLRNANFKHPKKQLPPHMAGNQTEHAKRDGNPHCCTDGYSGTQTVEAGWMHYGDIADTYDQSKDQQSFLFTFFTTNGYRSMADYICGYLSYVKGWVQYDSEVHPGYFFSPVSTIGGTQKELTIGYTLHENNWWCSVGGKFIGYYPSSLFNKNSANPSNTLAAGANQISFYGEVTNEMSTYTTSDMGSGNYSDQVYGKAAYIKNIQYYSTNDQAVNFDTYSVQVDTQRGYQVQSYFNSGNAGWNSYMFLGGPGGDGKVGT